MTFILNLETSTSVCSVSVAGDGKISALREQMDAKSHASQLIPFISEALREAGITTADLSAIAVSKGPGSYTGLRIGVSTAKGLAYALGVPLISTDTLLCMASGFMGLHPDIPDVPGTLLCPMIDARRMEVYYAVFDTNLRKVREVKAEIIDGNSFRDLGDDKIIHFFGDGAMKCKDLINIKSGFFHGEFHPSAAYMVRIAFSHFMENRFENLAYFEPFYLKDFVATIPGNKMF